MKLQKPSDRRRHTRFTLSFDHFVIVMETLSRRSVQVSSSSLLVLKGGLRPISCGIFVLNRGRGLTWTRPTTNLVCFIQLDVGVIVAPPPRSPSTGAVSEVADLSPGPRCSRAQPDCSFLVFSFTSCWGEISDC